MQLKSVLLFIIDLNNFVFQERLDFAMREIIYDLLSVGKPIRGFSPEVSLLFYYRMNNFINIYVLYLFEMS